jgi:hypothetical protein
MSTIVTITIAIAKKILYSIFLTLYPLSGILFALLTIFYAPGIVSMTIQSVSPVLMCYVQIIYITMALALAFGILHRGMTRFLKYNFDGWETIGRWIVGVFIVALTVSLIVWKVRWS